jgi:branched-chain amino acid transport system ATP-binding protein
MTDSNGLLLRSNKITKRFGGLTAVNEVSLDLRLGQIHAVIGPNGAGKSTLTNLLTGDLPATSGHVALNGQDITGWTPERISRHGLGRSYQKTNIFKSFTVWDNVRLSAQSRSQPLPFNPLAWLTQAKDMKDVNLRAERAIELAGLQNRRNALAGAASHGEQRQLEIAMTLATEPKVLLLDEPLAGMGVAEAESMVQLLLRLKPSHAMMLVEHDIDAIFTLSDQLTVMVNGQVIASGLPADVRADKSVQTAYLGEDH